MKTQTERASKKLIWTGRVVSALPALFLLIDAVMKFMKPPIVVETTVRLGLRESTILGIGFALLVCTVVYVIPRTSILERYC